MRHTAKVRARRADSAEVSAGVAELRDWLYDFDPSPEWCEFCDGTGRCGCPVGYPLTRSAPVANVAVDATT
jgi:hypothetical protein